ncbi:MAG: hypothetical protein KF881_10095 [Acidobacteria bacterium]|nr:hypothetical protein [Acidobacteriota bacterium]
MSVVIMIGGIGVILIPVEYLLQGKYTIEYAQKITSLKLWKYEVIGHPDELRKWLSKGDGAPGQEATVMFVIWGLTHQDDFELILDGFPEEKKQANVNFIASMIDDRLLDDEFLNSFENHNSPTINELREKVLEYKNDRVRR